MRGRRTAATAIALLAVLATSGCWMDATDPALVEGAAAIERRYADEPGVESLAVDYAYTPMQGASSSIELTLAPEVRPERAAALLVPIVDDALELGLRPELGFEVAGRSVRVERGDVEGIDEEAVVERLLRLEQRAAALGEGAALGIRFSFDDLTPDRLDIELGSDDPLAAADAVDALLAAGFGAADEVSVHAGEDLLAVVDGEEDAASAALLRAAAPHAQAWREAADDHRIELRIVLLAGTVSDVERVTVTYWTEALERLPAGQAPEQGVADAERAAALLEPALRPLLPAGAELRLLAGRSGTLLTG